MASGPTSPLMRFIRKLAARPAGAPSDGELLQQFAAGRDESAFAALVQRHGAMVLNVCRNVLGDADDADDVFQATFLVLVRRAAVVPRGMVANWLYGVAHRTALKARTTVARRRAREKQVMTMPEPAVAQQTLWDDLQRVLDQELSRLPDKYRVVIVLCELEGKTRKEAARQLHVPEGTVASRLVTARAMLARRLRRQGLAVSGGALAAALAQSAASAGMPFAVVSSTIRAAGLIAAGRAAAPGVVSAKAVVLAEGVVKTMLLAKLKVPTAVLAALVVLGAGTAALTHPGLAERPAASAVTPLVGAAGADVTTPSVRGEQPTDPPVNPKKEPATATISGVLKAVNFGTITVTVTHQSGEGTYTVAQDAPIVIDGSRGNLAGLAVGSFVTLKLWADQKTAGSIEAERPQVSGVVKAVDAEKYTLTVEANGAERTFAVARDAVIHIDDVPGRLAELPAGARVTLGRTDRQTVNGIRAVGPAWRHVIVTAVDVTANTITFGNVKSPVELGGVAFPLVGKTLPVPKDAVVTIDGKPGKLSGVPPGALVAPFLAADQKRVRRLDAYGPGGKASVKEVDVSKGTITLGEDPPPAGNSDHETLALAGLAGKTLRVAREATIKLDGKPGKLAGLPAGARIGFGLSVDRQTVLIIHADGPGWRQVVAKAVDATANTITFDDDKAPAELAGRTLPLAQDADLRIDGQPGKLAGLPPGVGIDVGLSVDQKAVRSVRAVGPGWTGVFVKAVDAANHAVTFDDDKAPAELAGRTFPVAPGASVQLDGKPGRLAGLPPGARIDVGLSTDRKAVRSVQAAGPAWPQVVVKAVDAAANTITVDDEKAPEALAGKTFPLAPDADIRVNGSRGRLAAVPAGVTVALSLSLDQKTVRGITVGR